MLPQLSQTFLRSKLPLMVMMMLVAAVILLLLLPPIDAAKRRYRHTASEIRRCNETVIAPPGCARNETPIFVHTVAQTSGKYFDRRSTIRRTWAEEAREAGFRIFFVIGRPEQSKIEQKLLEIEARKFGDILQFNFTENYYNLTLKAIAELTWAARHCNKSRYLIKLDDDVIVNVPLLRVWIAESRVPSGMTGRVLSTPANRRPGHKWYMPTRYYRQPYYKFLSGFGYILSIDRLKPLLATLRKYRGPILDIDDLFLTGVIADKGRIKRYNSFRFKFYCGLNVCAIETAVVIHACPSSEDTATMYRVWKHNDVAICHRPSFFGPPPASLPQILPPTSFFNSLGPVDENTATATAVTSSVNAATGSDPLNPVTPFVNSSSFPAISAETLSRLMNEINALTFPIE